MRNTKANTQAQPGQGHCPSQWLQPVAGDDAQPCGPNLEYDNDYAVLQSLLRPKEQVQYGSFTAEPQPPDWAAVERQARALSQRTRDITVLVALTRARTHRAGAVGLREGLAVLHAQLHLWPAQVHPQARAAGKAAQDMGQGHAKEAKDEEEDEDDALVRANALAALADPQGLLADIRGVAISTSAAAPLTVRDVERALSPSLSVQSAYPGQGPDAQAVRLQLVQLRHRCDERLQALIDSAQLAQDIAQWSQSQLQQDAPELTGLSQLLGHVRDYRNTPDKVQAEAVEESAAGDEAGQARTSGGTHHSNNTGWPLADLDNTIPGPHPAPAHAPGEPTAGSANMVVQREHIRALLGQVIEWIEHHEPSSPVSIVLRQAQNLWGKRYAEIIAAVPPELLAQWDAQLNNKEARS